MIKISEQFTDEGFVKKTVNEIILEKETIYQSLFDIINNSPSDILWQWMKNGIYEREEIETLIEISSEQMSISQAAGTFLDKFGIECGILRKGATKAQGYVEVTTTISGSSFTVPAGTVFASPIYTYISDDAVEIPYVIEMTKTKDGESDDYFSSDIESVTTIVKILDENNNVIDPSFYSLDSTYKNFINWTVGSSAVLVKNQTYYVYISGSITHRIEVSSSLTGAEVNASIGTITSCITYPTLSVTNREAVDGAADIETDDRYRARLLEARRRTYTLGAIKSMILGMEGVRACKVYQDKGVDQTSITDWDNPSIVSYVNISGTVPLYSQNFVPGNHVLTLGRITLYGNAINDPPAICCGIKRNIDGCSSGTYFDYDYVEEFDLDQSLTGNRDINFELNYNGLDKTKTYRFDLWCKDPNNPSFDWATNYWQVALTDEVYGTGSRKELMAYAGPDVNGDCTWVGLGDSVDLMFKTWYKGAGFTSIIATEDGYGYTNLTGQIVTYLDYVDEGGYSPICIQYQLFEANEVLIDVKGTIYITELADFQNVRREINEGIENYLENLDVGTNVIYSRIYQIIMDHEQVYSLRDLYIKRNDEVTWVQHDLGILDDEIPDLGAPSFQRG